MADLIKLIASFKKFEHEEYEGCCHVDGERDELENPFLIMSPCAHEGHEGVDKDEDIEDEQAPLPT